MPVAYPYPAYAYAYPAATNDLARAAAAGGGGASGAASSGGGGGSFDFVSGEKKDPFAFVTAAKK